VSVLCSKVGAQTEYRCHIVETNPDVINMDRNERNLNNSILSISTDFQKAKNEHEQEWTIECTIDELFLNLISVREIITDDHGRSLPVRKYYRRARELMKWIPIARLPSSDFVISIYDLTPKLRKEIESIILSPTTLQYVLTQAVGRLFENLDFEYYHFSVARNLRVKFEP
jgi:hypothetical protein